MLRARYDVRHDDGVFARDGYLAGSDERRLAELRAALADPDARAIVMARGGYGLMRLLPFIDVGALRRTPAADRRLFRRDGAAGAGGARRRRVDPRPGRHAARRPRRADQRALFERLETPGPGPLLDGLEGLIPGRVRGPLLGGNLEMFSRLVGTPYLPDVSGAILFFEDLGERPYRVDRLLAHLDLAGVFGAASGGRRRRFLRLPRAGGDARRISDGGRGAGRAAGPPADPGGAAAARSATARATARSLTARCASSTRWRAR